MEESAGALEIVYHVARDRLGRRRLAVRTGLTEMGVRVELERLRDLRLVRMQRAGVELTPAGRRRFARYLEPVRSVAELALTSLRLDDVSLAAHLAAPTAATTPVWSLRDEAIRGGASGLLLLRRGADGWRFAHDDEPIAAANPVDAAVLDATFPDPREGDLLLVASGPDRRRAGLGLWHAIASLVSHAS